MQFLKKITSLILWFAIIMPYLQFFYVNNAYAQDTVNTSNNNYVQDLSYNSKLVAVLVEDKLFASGYTRSLIQSYVSSIWDRSKTKINIQF